MLGIEPGPTAFKANALFPPVPVLAIVFFLLFNAFCGDLCSLPRWQDLDVSLVFPSPPIIVFAIVEPLSSLTHTHTTVLWYSEMAAHWTMEHSHLVLVLAEGLCSLHLVVML